MSSKINWLIENSKPGMLVLQSWLSKHGVSPSLAATYRNSTWLNKLSAGLYVRVGREQQWQDVVVCLQNQANIAVHLAGLSSLGYQGRSHYLQLNSEKIWLSLAVDARMPTWFTRLPDNDRYVISTIKLSSVNDKDLMVLDIQGEKIWTSTQELAILEVLEAVPSQISFEHAAELFQGLVNLSPRRLQSLLERHKSVKTKRLFFFLARYNNHTWLKRLDEDKIDLGAGKRQIVKGGRFDTRYQITVPANFNLELQ